MGDVFDRITRKVGNSEAPALSITAGVGFVDQREKFSRVIAGKNLVNYTHLQRGDFAYNKGNSDRFPQGCIYQLREFESGAVPNVYYSFGLSDPKADGDFYRHLFESGFLNRQLRRLINMGVRNDGLLNLSASDFFSTRVPVPSPEEQTKLGQLFNAVESELLTLRKLKRAIGDQKRGLMQKLLTGEVRVKVDEKEAA